MGKRIPGSTATADMPCTRDCTHHDECPVCYCPLRGNVCGVVSDNNSLRCPAGHGVCVDCMRRLVEPCHTASTGFCVRCPMCREVSALSRLHVMVLIYGTWERAEERFESEAAVRKWTCA